MTQTDFCYRILRLVVVCFPLLLSACMIVPSNNDVYTNRSLPIAFRGYVDVPNAKINLYVAAWDNPSDCTYMDPELSGVKWQLLGTTYSATVPNVDGKGHPWYYWSDVFQIPVDNWCFIPPNLGIPGKPHPPYATLVHGTYRYYASQLGTKWRNLNTVEHGVNCASVSLPNPYHYKRGVIDGLAMYTNCSRKGPKDYAAQIWAN